MPEPLLHVSGLVKTFPLRRSLTAAIARVPHEEVRACDGIDLTLERGETVAIVGESGSGKSTLARSILLLERPDAGEVVLDGRDLQRLGARELRRARRDVQLVQQDPLAALNPRTRIWQAVSHPLRTHGVVGSRREAREMAAELLTQVELRPELADRYPHELSGGQCQRVCIARAIALRPKLLIADEPVSALDLPVQAQIINLLRRLQLDLGVACLFISHDLRVVRHISSQVAVMRRGQIVEHRPTPELFAAPRHPYTRQLLASVPRMPRNPSQSAPSGGDRRSVT